MASTPPGFTAGSASASGEYTVWPVDGNGSGLIHTSLGWFGSNPSTPKPVVVSPVAILNANRTPAPTPAPKWTPDQALRDLLYGNPIPISAGRRLIRGRPLWWTQPRTITVPSLVSATDGSPNAGQLISTGAAAGSTATVMDIAVSFGAPLGASGKRDILQIRAGVATNSGDPTSTIIYDTTTTPHVNAVGLNFTFYPGSETQLPDPTIEADKGIGTTQAYRGQMYAVFKDFPIDLFIENSTAVEPLFAALIADDSFSSVVHENFTVTSGSTIRTTPAVDWTGSVAYFSGYTTSFRILAFNLWGAHSELYDVPVKNLTTAFQFLDKQIKYIDGLGLLLAIGEGSGINPTFVLISPVTGRIICEADNWITILGSPDNVLGSVAWSIDTLGTVPVYVFAVTSNEMGKLQVFRYDPDLNEISEVGHTANYLDGNAVSSFFTITSMVRGASEGGRPVFYIGSSTKLHKLVVDIDSATPFTWSVLFTPAAQINLLHFLPQENALISFDNAGTAVKIRCSDGAVLWTATPGFTPAQCTATGAAIVSTEGWRRSRGYFGYIDTAADNFYLLDLTDGSVTIINHAVTAGRQQTFDSETKSFILSDFGGDPDIYLSDENGSSSYPFSAMALALAETSGYADGQVTVDGIPETFGGLMIDQDTYYLDFLTSNQELLNYEIVEDQTIRVFRIPDNPTIDVTITPDMCVDSGGKNGPIVVRQEQETSFASVLEIQYVDASLDYATGSQTVKRSVSPIPTTASYRKDTITSQLIMTPDQAVSLGTPVIYRRAIGATKLSLTGMPLLGGASPGDVALIESGSNNYTAKIIQTSLQGGMSNQITAQSILTQSVVVRSGSSGWVLPFTVTMPATASLAILLDGPLLGYRDDLGGRGLSFRWAATSRGQANWSGAQFYFSLDNVNYDLASGIALSAQTLHVAAAIDALPDNPMPFMTDYTNEITAVPTSGDFGGFSSVSYGDLMNGLTLAYIGQPGRWEVIGWQTVAANSNGTYSFSGLLRGLYGTEVFSGAHQPGDLFIPIPGNAILKGTFPTSELGDTIYFRGVGIGQKVLSALADVATVSGNAERPPAPPHLDAVIAGSDIDLSCDRRSRYQVHLSDTWAIVDSEDVDEWQFDILSGGDVVRTLTSATPAATYLAADITTDFGSPPASLNFRAYRVGHDGGFSVGRGFKAEATVALS